MNTRYTRYEHGQIVDAFSQAAAPATRQEEAHVTQFDTRTVNRHEIEDQIVKGVLAHGTSAAEFLANCGGGYREAAQAVDLYYATAEGVEWPVDQDGDELDVYQYAYGYFERHCPPA